MVHFATLPTTQPPDDHPVPTSYYMQTSSVDWTHACFAASYPQFPALSFSTTYLFSIITAFSHPYGVIILGYSRPGKTGGCGAFGGSGYNLLFLTHTFYHFFSSYGRGALNQCFPNIYSNRFHHAILEIYAHIEYAMFMHLFALIRAC